MLIILLVLHDKYMSALENDTF